jgi:hypothetical protein
MGGCSFPASMATVVGPLVGFWFRAAIPFGAFWKRSVNLYIAMKVEPIVAMVGLVVESERIGGLSNRMVPTQHTNRVASP